MGTLPTYPRYRITWAADGAGDLAITSAGPLSRVYQRRGTTEADWTEIGGNGSGSGPYINVLDHGLVADNSTDNTPALNALINSTVAGGGGTLYFPSGNYAFRIDNANDTIVIRNLPNARLRFVGDGRSSCLVWSGDAGGAAHFFHVQDGTSKVQFEQLYLVMGTITNKDSAEQHHLIYVETSGLGHCEYVAVRNCDFGFTYGDAFNASGGVSGSACHAAVAANLAAGSIGGVFTPPSKPARVAVRYSDVATWDGGTLTVTGTDINGTAQTELIPLSTEPSGPDSTMGELYFGTVTSAVKSATGIQVGSTASIGYVYEARNIWVEGCSFDGHDIGPGHTHPNDGIRSAIGVQRLARDIWIQRNWMTGSNDQLIDFEPTGNGTVGPWYIEDNVILVSNPSTPPAGNPHYAVTFFGTDQNTGRNRSRFCRNYVYGAVFGGKLRYAEINDNFISTQLQSGTPTQGGGLVMSGTADDVICSRNTIIADPTLNNAPISFQYDTTTNRIYRPNGLRILDNLVRWSQGPGITVEAPCNVQVCRNTLIYESATANTHNAIVLAAKVNGTAHGPIDNVLVADNLIDGNFGGGTLAGGIVLQPGAETNTDISITGNRGQGCVIGISIPAGTYAQPPVVIGNGFPVTAGAGVVFQTAGNQGGIAIYSGAPTDPSALADFGATGSGYQSSNGNHYIKTASGAANWKTVTHA